MKMENKRGNATFGMILLIVGSFVVLLVLGVYLFAFNTITSSLNSQDVSVGGDLNLSGVTGQTIGQINNSLILYGDYIAIAVLFGIVFGLILAAFLTRKKRMAIFFVVDFIIMIFFYILSTYISNAYETSLASITFSSTFTEILPIGSSFVLNLPLITTITGAIIMLISYAAIPRSKEEEIAGF